MPQGQGQGGGSHWKEQDKVHKKSSRTASAGPEEIYSLQAAHINNKSSFGGNFDLANKMPVHQQSSTAGHLLENSCVTF